MHALFHKLKSFSAFQVGGIDEYEICNAVKDGRIKKPVVAWCIGTCASMLSTEVSIV